jgi:uncharacterized membrane protein SirB2
LVAAILLTLIIRQYPLTAAWLTAKLGLLVVYIVLGSVALKRVQTKPVQLLAFVSAVGVYGYIISIAVTHHPLGIFHLLGG